MPQTGSELIAEVLVKEGIPYVVGIPGHGNLALVDAFRRQQGRLRVIQVRHEQAAVHLADGYCRVRGIPLPVFTSIGPGATNTVIGLATAYVDSIPVLVMCGSTHTYMRGVGVLQEVERQRWSDLARVMEPVTKQVWQISDAGQLPRALSAAFNAMLTGRPGPVLLDLPMDVQAQSVEAEVPETPARRPASRPTADAESVRKAARLLVQAKRPVILAGGGVLLSRGEGELRALAEHLGACVVTTMMGKGALREDHPLYGWHAGTNGTTVGNAMTRQADVLLAVGVRFSDKTSSSYRHGVTFNIPPTKLIHLDIDPREIGKNYPVEIGLVGDAQATLAALLAEVQAIAPARNWRGSPYTAEIAAAKAAWFAQSEALRTSNETPVTMGRALAELRRALPENGIVTTSSGNTQAQVFQEMAFTQPRTYLSAGGFSTMGWAFPAAMGAKLAAPEAPVVAVVGDGDFLMTFQELATAVQYNIPVVAMVFNNLGWQAIRDLQIIAFGEESPYATMFERDGQPISPHIANAARAFGAYAERIERPDEVAPALQRALQCGGPAVIEVMVDNRFGRSGGVAPGWWDVPVPGYYPSKRATYEKEKAEERV